MPRNLIKNIKNYFRNEKEVIAVYLFGSYATGKERLMSDIDIGVLLNHVDQHKLKKIRDKWIVELSRISRKDIHPVILNYAGEGLMNQIFQKGKCILKNDPKKLSIYEMITLAKIAEFAYYRHTMQSGFVKKVMGE